MSTTPHCATPFASARRIAIVHSFYGSSVSGENTAVLSEADALRRAGHDVRLFSARTDELEGGRLYALRAGIRVASGRGRAPLAALRAFDPHVVHVHNLFPNFSTNWLHAVEAPVIATVHNYRPMCAAGTLFRGGAVCTLCVDGGQWSAVRYGCYRGSRGATAPLAWANRRGVTADVVLDRADHIILLSELQRSIYVRAGLPEARITVIPNFVPDDLDPGPHASTTGARRGWLVVGRLNPEKGILELVQRWPQGVPLTIVGDGPLRGDVERACAGPGRNLVPTLPRREVVQRMTRYVGLAVPSRWFEACPLVYVEALAAGLPVLAWEPSGVAEFVRADASGVAVPEGAEPSSAVLSDAPWNELAGASVRSAFEGRYTEAAFVRAFLALIN